jgi:hypothetical protein
MNYNTIEELINAGTSNATVLYNGSIDDQTFDVAIPSWVKVNGHSSGKLYYSSNSWLSVRDANTEQIRYNRRDTRMYAAYLEEGTIYNHYNFIRYRFYGTTVYSGTTVYEWEIFFFDTGDIMIRGISMPETDGAYNIVGTTTYTYNKPTIENPYVTFYSLDENNSTFRIDYDIIKLGKIHYLAQDTNNVFYTVNDNALVPLEITNLTSEVFKEYGFTFFEEYSSIFTIQNLKLYSWSDYNPEPPKNIYVHAIPYNQVIYSDNLYRPQVGTYVTVLGIESVTIEYEGSPLIAVSFDDGETWRAFKNKQWVHLEQENSGNTPAEIISISTPEWNEQFDVSRQIRFRFTLTEGDSITNLTVHYINPAE